MRKFYSIFLTALLTLVSVSASAIDITVNVDDPARVSVSVNYGAPLENLVAGDNAISVDEYQSVNIKAKSGAFLTKVVKSMEGMEDSEQYVSNLSECNLYISSGDAGAKYTVTSLNADEARDASCTVWVDDPENVQLQRSGTYSYVDLVAGDNTVKFISGQELPLTIGPKNYGTQLYQVKCNGEVVAPEGSSWRISPAEGDKIEIFANFPDIDIPVSFTYASEDAKGFITGVTVNDEPVDNYNDDGFTVKAGSRVVVNGNTSDYNLVSFKVNGSSIYFYGSYNFVVTEETVIEVDAHKYGTVKATLDIDNPDNVVAYRGYSHYNDIIGGLVSGENEIELSETNTMIQIMAASGCYLTSVTANGETISADYNGAYNVTVTEGMSIVVRSGAIERNSKAVVYIDDRAAATQYFSFQRSDRSQIDIATGYNEINFYEGDNPFGLSWYGASYANVYKNGEALAPLYEGSTTYELNLTDGDVVKIFLASNPEKCETELIAASDVDMSRVAVTMDRMTTLTDWAGTHTVLPGTEVSLKPAEGYSIGVKANGKDVVAGEDGAFTVTVNAKTTISVSLPGGTGVDGIEAAETAGRGVYNLRGVRVADKTDLKRLPAGVYIVGGKKIVKR